MRPRILVFLTVLMVCAASYMGLRQNGYVYEDNVMRDIANGGALELSAWNAPNRNLARLSVKAVSLFSGVNVETQHAAGLALHLLNGVLLALVAETFIGGWGAILAATIFLWAPIQVETSAYIASRPDLLMTTFFLLALVCLRVGAWHWSRLIGVALCVVGAAYSKQAGILIGPLLMLAWPRAHRAKWSLALISIAGAYLITRSGGVLAAWQQHGLPYSQLQNAAYQSAAWWRMVSLLVWPAGLSLDHDIGATPVWAAFIALAGLGFVAVCGLCLSGVRRLALLWPVIVVLPRLFITLPEFFNEHQFYSAMLGVSLGIGSFFPQKEPA